MGTHDSRAGQPRAELADRSEVDVRDAPARAAVLERLALAAVVRGNRVAQQPELALRARRGVAGVGRALEQADAADHRRGMDRLARVLVVERDVAAHDRRAEHLAGLGHAGDRLAQHVGGVRALGVAEVEAVRDRSGRGSRAGDVQGRLADRLTATAQRVERDARAIAIERHGDPALARRQAQHARVSPRSDHGPRADELVVLLGHPALRADVRRGEQAQQQLCPVADRGRRRHGVVDKLGWPLGRKRIARCLRQHLGRDLTDHLAVEPAAQDPIVGDLPDRRARQLPARADGREPGVESGIDDRRHALLRLRDHDLERFHAVLAQRHQGEVEIEADAPRCSHLARRRGEARGSEILDRDGQPELGQLERALDQLLAGERVADLHGRPLLVAALVEILRRQHARPADAVAAGQRAVEDDEVSRAGRASAHEPLQRQHADRHRVDQGILAIGRVEDRLAADVRDANRVPVAADAPHDPAEELARTVLVERAQAQRVKHRDRPGSHREDVAQDPADAGRCALHGLDRRGVVVALDLERDAEPVAHVDHAGVLAGTGDDARSAGGKAPQLEARVLVAAVLGPQQGEDRELEAVRGSTEPHADLGVLGIGQPEGSMSLFGRLRHPVFPSVAVRPSAAHKRHDPSRPRASDSGRLPP